MTRKLDDPWYAPEPDAEAEARWHERLPGEPWSPAAQQRLAQAFLKRRFGNRSGYAVLRFAERGAKEPGPEHRRAHPRNKLIQLPQHKALLLDELLMMSQACDVFIDERLHKDEAASCVRPGQSEEAACRRLRPPGTFDYSATTAEGNARPILDVEYDTNLSA